MLITLYSVTLKAASIREPMDRRVEHQIMELTKQGVKKSSEMRRHIGQYVNVDLFRGESPPPATRRRFYPLDKDIRNIMSKARDEGRQSKIDQVNLNVSIKSTLIFVL